MNQKPGYFKIGLVIVLALVFLLAIGHSVRSVWGGPPAAPIGAVGGVPATPAAVQEPTRPPQATTQQPWPIFELADIIAFDPFGSGQPEEPPPAARGLTASASPATNEAGEASAGGRTTAGEANAAPLGRIQAVYQRGGRSAVIVDSRTLRAGDSIEGTGRIIEVDQGGVTVEVHH
jgi:hypothetical protein